MNEDLEFENQAPSNTNENYIFQTGASRINDNYPPLVYSNEQKHYNPPLLQDMDACQLTRPKHRATMQYSNLNFSIPFKNNQSVMHKGDCDYASFYCHESNELMSSRYSVGENALLQASPSSNRRRYLPPTPEKSSLSRGFTSQFNIPSSFQESNTEHNISNYDDINGEQQLKYTLSESSKKSRLGRKHTSFDMEAESSWPNFKPLSSTRFSISNENHLHSVPCSNLTNITSTCDYCKQPNFQDHYKSNAEIDYSQNRSNLGHEFSDSSLQRSNNSSVLDQIRQHHICSVDELRSPIYLNCRSTEDHAKHSKPRPYASSLSKNQPVCDYNCFWYSKNTCRLQKSGIFSKRDRNSVCTGSERTSRHSIARIRNIKDLNDEVVLQNKNFVNDANKRMSKSIDDLNSV